MGWCRVEGGSGRSLGRDEQAVRSDLIFRVPPQRQGGGKAVGDTPSEHTAAGELGRKPHSPRVCLSVIHLPLDPLLFNTENVCLNSAGHQCLQSGFINTSA